MLIKPLNQSNKFTEVFIKVYRNSKFGQNFELL